MLSRPNARIQSDYGIDKKAGKALFGHPTAAICTGARGNPEFVDSNLKVFS